MNTTQLPFLVEGILLVTAGIFGIFLDRAGKPYGKVKLFVHLFFALWFTVGFGFIVYGILTMSSVTKGIWLPVAVMGLAILTQLVTGILMMASKKAGMAFPKIHLFSAIAMILSDICAFFMSGIRS
jgi:heme A synthase